MNTEARGVHRRCTDVLEALEAHPAAVVLESARSSGIAMLDLPPRLSAVRHRLAHGANHDAWDVARDVCDSLYLFQELRPQDEAICAAVKLTEACNSLWQEHGLEHAWKLVGTAQRESRVREGSVFPACQMTTPSHGLCTCVLTEESHMIDT